MPVVTAYEYHATIPAGQGIRTDPPEGTLVEEDATITLYVSLGPSPVSQAKFSQSTSTIYIGLGSAQ